MPRRCSRPQRRWPNRPVAADLLFEDRYLAGLYDHWHPRSVRDDYDFYLPHILNTRSALDLGCGTGGLLRDARDRGHRGRLCGLDPAAAMIALASRRSDIDWVVGELVEMSWVAEFNLAVMTGHAFQTLLTDDNIRSFLAALARTLAPGGRFLFETRNPLAEAWSAWRPENAVTIADAEGALVKITTRIVRDFDGASVTFAHAFDGRGPSLPIVSVSTLRFLDQRGLDRFLVEAGFRIDERFGDFQGGAVGPASPELITFASVGAG